MLATPWHLLLALTAVIGVGRVLGLLLPTLFTVLVLMALIATTPMVRRLFPPQEF